MKTRQALTAFVALWALAAPVQAQTITNPPLPYTIGAAYNATPPTLSDGTAGWLQLDSSGNLRIAGTVTASFSGTGANNADNVAAVATGLMPSVAYNYVWDGATWDRLYGDSTNGAFVNIKAMIAIPAGTAIIGKVGIDQTTPGTTNGVQLTAATANIYVGNVNTQSTKATYRAAVTNTIDAAGVFFQLQGSGTKTIRITRIVVSGKLTVSSNGRVFVERNSTAASGGTSGSTTMLPLDSTSAAATATATNYSAVPTIGTLVGAAAVQEIMWAADTVLGSAAEFNFGVNNGQAMVLNGTGQYMTIRTAGFGSYTGAVYAVTVEWTEE